MGIGIHISASRALLFVLLAGLLTPNSGQTSAQEHAFTEAQRYHLGIERPRDSKKAADLYQQAIRENPRNTDARYNLAHLDFMQKRYDLAAKSYTEVIRMNPEDSDAYKNLGTIYERQGKIKAATKLYMKATKTERPVPAAYYNLGRFYLEQGSEEQAQIAISKAIALEPENEAFIKLHSKVMGDIGRLSGTTIGYVIGGLVVTLTAGSVVLYKGNFLS